MNNTFDNLLRLAPLFRRSSTILSLPRSEAHIRAVHPCCDSKNFFKLRRKQSSYMQRWYLVRNQSTTQFLSHKLEAYYWFFSYQLNTLSDSLVSMDVERYLSFCRMYSTVFKSSFFAASMRSCTYVHWNEYTWLLSFTHYCHSILSKQRNFEALKLLRQALKCLLREIINHSIILS